MRRIGSMFGFVGLVAVVIVASVFGVRTTLAGPNDRPSGYLATGDSIAAGVGASDPARTGYVALVQAAFAPGRAGGVSPTAAARLGLTNISEGGATSASFVADQLPAAVAAIEAAAGTPQAVDDIALITVTIGGNDVFALLPLCSFEQPPIDPTSACGQALAATFAEVSTNLHTSLATLRAAAPDATIVVSTSYNSLPGCQFADLAALGEFALEGAGDSPGLNDLIRDAAAAHGARVAEWHGEITPEQLVGGEDCLHPNDAGHARLASIVTDAAR